MSLIAARSTSRSLVANLRSVTSRRFTSTATRQRPTRSWKNSVVRLGLGVGTLYYFNTSPVFAEAAPQTIPTAHPEDNPSEDLIKKQIHIKANIETTHENDRESIKNPKPQSGVQNGIAANDASDPEDKSQQGAYNPETGEFNWDCSCLGGMAHGPCGEEFKSSFSCFMLSTDEPKGMNCIEHFKVMQECFKKCPDVYGGELTDDAEGDPSPNLDDEQSDTSSMPMKAQSTTPVETSAASEEPERARRNEGPKKKVNAERI